MIDCESYRNNGYLLIKNAVPQTALDRIRSEAKEIFISQMRRRGIPCSHQPTETDFEQGMFRLFADDLETFSNCGKHAQHLVSLHALSLDDCILTVVKALGLEFASICTRPVLYFNSPRLATKEVYWRLSEHQDWRSMQGSLDSIVVWLPLVDVDADLGALEVIPGSHRLGLLQADLVDGYGHIKEPIDAGEFIPIPVNKGDALFFSSLLVHRSGTNSTESLRWSCQFRYNNLHEETFVQRGFPHPYIYRPAEQLLTPEFPTREQVEAVFCEDS